MYLVQITKIEKNIKKTTAWERLHDKSDFDSEKEPQYGYVSTEREITDEIEVYKQQLNEINLVKVIEAVNSCLIKKEEG